MKHYIIQLIILLNLLFSAVHATEWRIQHHLQMDFNAVWGSAANDVFAVGLEGLIFHYDGSQWREMDTGMTNSKVFYHLKDIWGTSSTDVFAVGSYGTILHYDGNQWTAMNSGSTINLEGIWGTSSTDVFAVGWNGTILHYDGNQWTAMNSGTSSLLSSVWASSSHDVFAGGDNGIFHYDGQQWTAMGVSPNVISIWGTSSTEVFVLSHSGRIFRYNGHQWRLITRQFDCYCIDLWSNSSTNDVFAVGWDGMIFHYDGSRWRSMDSGTLSTLTSIWGTSSTDIFAVGWDGTILHYDGIQWSTLNTMPNLHFNHIWGTSSTDIFVVGANGKILHSDGNQLTAMNSGTSSYLNDIWGSSNQDIFTVGTTGTILHYDGNNWTTLNSDTEVNLNGIWGSSATDIFVVGDQGTILHSDGNSWTTLDSGTSSNLNGIWGSSSTDVFVGGEDLILHYDGAQWTSETTGMSSSNIWGSSSQDVFMVVDMNSDRIFHYDGNQWQSINLGNFYSLTSLWGSSNTDVFAAGIMPDNPGWGIIFHYDGNTWMETTQIEMGSNASPSSALWGSPEGDVFAIIGPAILRCTNCQQQISELQPTPRSHNFWNIAAGDQASQTFTVTNTGSGDAQLQPLVLANTTDFAVNHDTCSNTLLTPTNTCQVTVDFQPQSEGTKLTKLTLSSSTATTDILLAGTGCSATFQQVFKLYPESPNLGTILVGDSATLNQTVSFTAVQGCGEELIIETIEILGQDAAEFSIQDLDCTNSHWDKYSYSYCRFNTVFTPTTAGEKLAELTFQLRDHPELLVPTVALPAKAITTGQAQLELTPTEYDFGSVTLGVGSSEPQTFILNNTGELSLKLDNFTLTGEHAAEFSLDQWSCIARNILHPGEQCDLNVWFMPSALGQKQANLTATASSLIIESLLTGLADSPKNCDNTNITIESSQNGNWNAPTTWSTAQIPSKTDVVRINAGHTVTGLAAAKVRTLCVAGILQSLDNQGTALEIQATDYLENQGLIRGQPGADELTGNSCTQASIVGTSGCAQPGASVILKVGTEFHQQDKLGDWWWYGSGGPILNTGEIIAGKGGDGSQYGAPGGNTLVLGRNTTNTNRIQAGDGGNILSTQSGQGGRGGLTQIWGKLGGPGHLYNQHGAQALAGNGGHCNPNGSQQTGGDGGNLWLVSLPDVHIEGGITQAGLGGDQCTVNGQDGWVRIEPNVISLAGAQTQVNGGNIAIYGGNNWTLDLSNLHGTVIEASGNITLAVGNNGLIDLRNSTGPILKALGEVQIFTDNILLEPNETLAEHIEANSIVVGPSKLLRDVVLVAPSKVSGKLGDTIPVQLTLTNGGIEEDVYTITTTDSTQNWQQLVVGPISGLETIKISVNFTISNTNLITLKASSQDDPKVFSTAEIFVIQIPVIVDDPVVENNPNSNKPKVVTPVTPTPSNNNSVKQPQPKIEPPQSDTDPLQLDADPPQPVVEPPQPVVEPPQPVVEPPQSVVEPPQSVVEPPQPVVEPPQSVVELPQLVVELPQPELIQDNPLISNSEPETITAVESEVKPNHFVVVTPNSNTCPTIPGIIIDWLCRNQGQVLTDVTLTSNAKVAGGQLAGTVDNQGFVAQVTIQPHTILTGGKLSGYIVNQGILKDFEFVGAQILGGTLAGNIINHSLVGGTFQDVYLAAGAYLSGGNLQGDVRGDPVAPALLEDLTIQAGSHLANVIIGKNVQWGEDVTFEDTVQFIEPPPIPCVNDLPLEITPILPLIDTMIFGHLSETCTQFAGGISTDGEIFQSQLTVNLIDEVEVRSRIAADPQQLNQTVDWVLYATYWATEVTPPVYVMVDDQGQVWPWEGGAEQLVAFEKAVVLKPLQEIIWYRGQFPVTGRLAIQFGYRLADETLIVNKLPLKVVIQK
jgi:hypothetical protein